MASDESWGLGCTGDWWELEGDAGEDDCVTSETLQKLFRLVSESHEWGLKDDTIKSKTNIHSIKREHQMMIIQNFCKASVDVVV